MAQVWSVISSPFLFKQWLLKSPFRGYLSRLLETNRKSIKYYENTFVSLFFPQQLPVAFLQPSQVLFQYRRTHQLINLFSTHLFYKRKQIPLTMPKLSSPKNRNFSTCSKKSELFWSHSFYIVFVQCTFLS